MKILITEFMDVKSVEILKINFDVTIDQGLSTNTNELKKTINGSMQFVERTLSKVVIYKMNKYFFLPYYYRGGKNFNVGYLSLLEDLDSIRFYRKDEVKFQPATFSPTTIEIGFPPRFIKRKLFFIQKKEATPIQIGKRKLIKLIESLSLNLEIK